MFRAWIGSVLTVSVTLIAHMILFTLAARIICQIGCEEHIRFIASQNETVPELLAQFVAVLFIVPFAAIVTLPFMPVVYPLALAVARRLLSTGWTALVGLLVSLILMLPIMICYVWIKTPPMYRHWLGSHELLEGLLLWAPPVACAGAFVGWTVARRATVHI